jgi:hypothetical protein
LHKREGRHAEKAHKVGIFIDMIHVAEGLNPMLCSENGWLVFWKSCGASSYGSFFIISAFPHKTFYATGRSILKTAVIHADAKFAKKNKECGTPKIVHLFGRSVYNRNFSFFLCDLCVLCGEMLFSG